jgi:hypothetical protein
MDIDKEVSRLEPEVSRLEAEVSRLELKPFFIDSLSSVWIDK